MVHLLANADDVAPLVGAWIESKMKGIGIDECDVAPLVGAWIESAIQCHFLFRS